MIIYKDIIKKLSDNGYNTNRIRTENLISESVLTSIRSGKSISMKNVDIICKLTNCSPGDLLDYIPDKTEE